MRGAEEGSIASRERVTQATQQPLHRPSGSRTASTSGSRAARARAERLRAGGLLAALVGALRLQAFGARCCAGCRRDGARVLQGPGENAGVIDLGDGLAVAFKVESHNHPSAVEPFQGAATGVGGILRDIFAMGARPIALLDSLRSAASTRSARASCSAAPSRGIGALRQLRRRPERRRRGRLRRRLPPQLRSSTRCASACCRADAARARERRAARATSSSSTAPRRAATASAARSVLARQELGEADDGQAPDRAGRRPVHRARS